MYWGYLLVIIGLLLLLKNLGILTYPFWEIFFPCLIIFCGLAILYKKKKNKKEDIKIE